MNCDDVQDLLVEYLLDELSEDNRSEITKHLQKGCIDCLALERELMGGADALWAAIPDEPVSPELRSRILTRATATNNLLNRTDSISISRRSVGSNSRAGVLPYVLAFAAGILLTAWVVPTRFVNSPVEKVAAMQVRSPSDSFAVNPATLPLDSDISAVKQTKTFLVSMERSNKSSQIEGHVVWDPLNHEVHFFGSGAERTPPGMVYVIWLTDQYRLPLATKELTLDENGRCKATLVSSIHDVRYVFITLESKIAGITRPSSNVQLSLDAVRFNLTNL